MALTLIPGTTYSQGGYFGEGVCCRLSFKWAAVTMMGGKFNHAMDSGGLNVASTKRKFGEYIDVSDKALSDTTKTWSDAKVFGDWVANDVLQAVQYINKWGVRVTDGSNAYGGITVDKVVDGRAAEFMASYGDSGITFVYGYYGYDKGSPAGHATAYSSGTYFDPNYGAYRSDAKSPAAIGADIDGFIAAKERDWTQKRFVIYVLSAAGATTAKR